MKRKPSCIAHSARSARSALSAIGLLACLAAASVQAKVTVYTSAAAFDAATQDRHAISFNGLVADNTFKYLPSGITVGGVKFGANGDAFLEGANAGYGAYGAAFFDGQGGTPQNKVTASFSALTAVAFTVGSYIQANQPVTATLSSGETFSFFTPAKPGIGTLFVGFVSTTPFVGVTFTETGSGRGVFDIVSAVTATALPAVPEPASASLLGLGAALMAVAARRRRL